MGFTVSTMQPRRMSDKHVSFKLRGSYRLGRVVAEGAWPTQTVPHTVPHKHTTKEWVSGHTQVQVKAQDRRTHCNSRNSAPVSCCPAMCPLMRQSFGLPLRPPNILQDSWGTGRLTGYPSGTNRSPPALTSMAAMAASPRPPCNHHTNL